VVAFGVTMSRSWTFIWNSCWAFCSQHRTPDALGFLLVLQIPGMRVEGNGPSLRRHNPDQVRRVSAAPARLGEGLAVSQLPSGAPLGTPLM